MGYLLLSLGFESGDTPYLFKLNPLFQHKLIQTLRRSWSWWGVFLGQCLGLLGNVKIPEEGEDNLSRKLLGNYTLTKVSGIFIPIYG